MSERIFLVCPLGKGRLSIGPRPLFGTFVRWLDELQAVNVSCVVSLLAKDEMTRYGLQGQSRALADAGISFIRFPIDDFHTPDAERFPELIGDLKLRLEAGEHIFAHCAGGIGRAGTTASCLLVEFGYKPDEAMAKVSEARGETCPETPEQVEFVRKWTKSNHV